MFKRNSSLQSTDTAFLIWLIQTNTAMFVVGTNNNSVFTFLPSPHKPFDVILTRFFLWQADLTLRDAHQYEKKRPPLSVLQPTA